MNNNVVYTIRRLFLVIFAGALMAFNLKTFVHAAELIPGGFTGLVLLIQQILLKYGNIHIPFSIMLFALNSIPVIFCFIFVGRKFTIYSVIMVIVTGLLTDWMPTMFIDIIKLHDTLLSAVFGGFINAAAISLCLYADACSGGTDFIAIFISEKYHKDSWNYIFIGNSLVLITAGFLFSLDKALYSIIFQYVTTLALGVLYHNYQQRSMFIITNSPNDVYDVINKMTHHGATRFNGFSLLNNQQRVLIYSVVTASEIKELIPAIKKIDNAAFINVIKTEQLNGRFYQKPKD